MADLVMKSETISHIGKIENIVGMAIEASGGKASIEIGRASCRERV